MPSQSPKPEPQEATTHLPFVQPATPLATEHLLPQAPQLFGSLAMFWQVELQQAPPAPQAIPQAPQLLGSVASLTQVALQHWPAAHGLAVLQPGTHASLTQMRPAPHSMSVTHWTHLPVLVSQTCTAPPSLGGQSWFWRQLVETHA